MARLINAEVLGFFATPPTVTTLLAEWFAPPAGDKLWRLLDPCCGEGVAAAQVATAVGGQVLTWGVELSPKRATRASQVLDKVLNTAWQATRLSKASVSLLWLNPPYDHDLDGEHRRLEIEFLRAALASLVYDGVLVYIVPQHLLGYRDVARLLLGHFDSLVVRRFPDGEYERFKQVLVLARRKPYTTPTAESQEALRALRDVELPPLTAPPADWRRELPPAPMKAKCYRIDIGEREQVAWGHALGWPEPLLQALQPQSQLPFCPPIPLKKGHVAMLMASGLMGTLLIDKDGERLLVKGRVRKTQDVSVEETEKGDVVTIKRDRFSTTVGVISHTGVEVLDDVTRLTTFMEEYGEELAGEILKHPPRYDLRPTPAEWHYLGTLGKQRQPLPGQAEAGLLPVQKHVTIALTRTLKAQGCALLQGEMGTGKTTVGLATIDALNAYPALVIGPPHLVEKWLREAAEVIPGVQLRELRKVGRNGGPGDINDVREFVTAWRAGQLGDKAIAVISETSAKLGAGWRGAMALRYTLPPLVHGRRDPADPAMQQRERFRQALKAYREARAQLRTAREDGDPAALAAQRAIVARLRQAALSSATPLPVCPDCGQVQEGRNGPTLSFKAFDKRPHRCQQPVQGWARDSQGRKLRDDDHRPTWTWNATDTYAPRCNVALYEFGDQYRRWPIADYIRRKCRHVFKMLVADEVHQFRGKDSDRGRAFHHLITATRYHLGLTGTVYGGKSTSVFYLFYRLFPKVRAEFPFHGEKQWAAKYGVLETRCYGTPGHRGDEGAEFGSFNATRRERVTVTEKPGVSPAILSQVVDHAIFLSLKDLGVSLPVYQEEALPLTMTAAQGAQYQRLESALRAQARQYPSWLSNWLQWSLSRPNSAFRPEVVEKARKDEDGRILEVITFMELPQVVNGVTATSQEDGELLYIPNGDDPLPKEAWLIDFVKAEKAVGRKTLIFARQTATRDIQPRLQAVLTAHRIRADVLYSSVSTRKRERWIERHAPRLDALICNPALVETGLDLVQFATVVFFEMTFDLYGVWQAMRRVWRLGQTQPVKVIFTSYVSTLEEYALRLMGKKMKSAQLLYGDSVGGAIVPEDGENFLTELARSVLEGQALPDLHQLFAAAGQVTHSPLGCPTAISPHLPVLSDDRLRELWEAQRAREAAKAQRRAARRRERIDQQLSAAGIAARQLGMF
jgi:hypothetical protein